MIKIIFIVFFLFERKKVREKYYLWITNIDNIIVMKTSSLMSFRLFDFDLNSHLLHLSTIRHWHQFVRENTMLILLSWTILYNIFLFILIICNRSIFVILTFFPTIIVKTNFKSSFLDVSLTFILSFLHFKQIFIMSYIFCL